ncbi:MPN domain-containing protein [Mycena indigotica]|uniref:MPN domain-containing protein n=1 Tax=Mycena indigotica TaxID=2126181 RepID=A0A8H6W0J2_9AGAR|nr:MPN domain-containing protein [Mycena indigotica]KAF7301034.1 MPN domain-containing protein [Mycena indigotica]
MPSIRPATIAELAAVSKPSPDNSQPLKYYLRLAETHKRAGRTLASAAGTGPTTTNPTGSYDVGLDLERSFIEFAKAATLIVDNIPGHRDYAQELTEKQKSNLSANGQDLLNLLGRVRTTLVERYERWSQSPAASAPDAKDAVPMFKLYPSPGSGPPRPAPQMKASQEAHLEAQRQMAEEAAMWKAQREEATRKDAQEGIVYEDIARRMGDESKRRAQREEAIRRDVREEAIRRDAQAYSNSPTSSASSYRGSTSSSSYTQASSQTSISTPQSMPLPVSMASMGGHPSTTSQPAALPPSFAARPSVLTSSNGNYPSSAGVSFPQPLHQSPSTPSSSTSYPSTPASATIPTPGPMPLRPLYEYDGESTDSEGPSGWRTTRTNAPQMRPGLPSLSSLSLSDSTRSIDGLPPSVNQHLSVTYPSLARSMSTHQRTQGYIPGASAPTDSFAGIGASNWGASQAIEAARTAAARPSELPPASYSTSFAPVSSPTQTQPQQYPQQQQQQQQRPSPPRVQPSASLDRRSSQSRRPSDPSALSTKLKTVVLPQTIIPRFLSIASANTARNLETCGLLLGREVIRENDKARYIVQTLLIPKQHATSDTCTMDEEEAVLAFTESRDLITLGWIHTHPSQSCFMSSVDLHTHASFQCMLPESFAVVCAPKSEPRFGIFRLTDPPGLKTVLQCTEKQAFHPHPDLPIYTDADKGHVQMRESAPLEIVDLR